jgi:hypothetical protein
MDTAQDIDDGLMEMPKSEPYEITAVHYQRLVSLGNYENERVGAWAQVKAGGTPEQALDALRTWVQAQVSLHQENQALESDIFRLPTEKSGLLADVTEARKRYERVKSFIESIGLKMPERFMADDDMPW